MGPSKKIIVTGGAGYIGSHTVVELIEEGYEPIIIDNFSNSDRKVIDRLESITGKKIIYYDADCRDMRLMENIMINENNVQGVIHFAAHKSVSESIDRPLEYFDNNLGSLETMLRVSKLWSIKDFVFSSSCTVYGQADEMPVTESTPMKKAESPYGETKQLGEKMIWSQRPKGAMILRYFNPVGAHPTGMIGEQPNGKPENLVPYITQVAVGKRERLSVFGSDYNTKDGTCVRDYIHVVDLAKAHVAALKRLGQESRTDVFNIGTGHGRSVLEAIYSFEQVNDLKLNYALCDRRPGDIEEIYADTSKANDLLGWKAEYDLSDALKHAWNWERKLNRA